MLKRLITTSAALVVVAACGDTPAEPSSLDRVPLVAAAPGDGQGQGAQFAGNLFEFFSFGSYDGHGCLGDYVDYPNVSDFNRTNPTGVNLERKQYQVDPLQVVLATGEVFTGSGHVFLSITRVPETGFDDAVWTATGRVSDAGGATHTAVCRLRIRDGAFTQASIEVK